MENWYEITDTRGIDSPALLVYPDRITYNIRLLKEIVGGAGHRLRPHVKTHKMIEVCKMMLAEGIQQFKCSTIAEAEMLALSDAPDVLLAYQPVGPKVQRWVRLLKTYPNTHFSCLVDNVDTIAELGAIAKTEQLQLHIYLDIDVGMGRTGAPVTETGRLRQELQEQEWLFLEGVHGYDGHIHNPDLAVRQQESNVSYARLKEVYTQLEPYFMHPLKIVIGGSPSFTTHAQREDVICSPGTFVFWDWGYRERIPEQEFLYAAVLLTRVISVVDDKHICVDLGYKAVASENPLPRVAFLNAGDAVALFQSEEHLVLEVADSNQYPIGKVLYAVPRHICPTVALYDTAYIIQQHQAIATWKVIGRNRILNI